MLFPKAKAPVHTRPEIHAATTVIKHMFFQNVDSRPDLSLTLR